MKFGIIGVGVIADFHRQAIENVDGAECIGVYDKFQEPAKNFAEKHNIKVFDSIESMVKDGGCQIVTIATPSGWHMEPAIEAMKAGAHVLCEKPLEVTTEKIDKMIATAKECGVKLGSVLQFRTFEGTKKAKAVIESGKLGKILIADAYIKYYRTQEYYDSAKWRGTWELDGGGATMNQGVHWVDCISWLAGDAEWVCSLASTLNHNIEVEDVCHSIVKWKSGAQGVIEATTCAKPGFESRIEIHGEKGSILLEDTKIKKMSIDGEEDYEDTGSEKGGGYSDPKAITTAGHEHHVRDMMEAVEQNRDPFIPPTEARRSVDLITAMYRSSREGGRVSL
ncbi:MAG: Gfo/Idh/MocA family oxidoreductase [Candidatus Omnitrophica bacterium]|nr:Gfo/Idh/MocA family oxidoreductase [Candidatus Omnitrophota bacterium]MCA9415942.1 Gfo/Idh/MocA family oxidoreductase [Candidatus Omnitrophota bacterium]MCA9424723.1 Gfo/Idh/MocA family oxidoreductase [Candidatus Omnitrophota bacterium]MCA9430648.1 Gfo/Idh/MocA family oxidoreductase [Candidatus Omnitrophota bacterium]MCA9434963.1 Gfo/Idh/MocA family oxidoreductase [Candidatus Omnitrophota bacterium]